MRFTLRTMGTVMVVPNLHGLLHQAGSIRMYASALNYDVRVKEHRLVSFPAMRMLLNVLLV